MCTRYYIEPSSEIREYTEIAEKSRLYQRMASSLNRQMIETGEVRPSDLAPVLAPSASGSKTAFPMVWGYHADWQRSPLVNARIETAGSKRIFEEDFRKHRCIVPASCYFEWKDTDSTARGPRKEKYAFKPNGCSITLLAGLYRIETAGDLKYPVFVILTRQAPPDIAVIHNRMPLILPESAVEEWIDPESDPESITSKALTDILYERAD